MPELLGWSGISRAGGRKAYTGSSGSACTVTSALGAMA